MDLLNWKIDFNLLNHLTSHTSYIICTNSTSVHTQNEDWLIYFMLIPELDYESLVFEHNNFIVFNCFEQLVFIVRELIDKL